MNDTYDEVLASCLDRLTDGESVAVCAAAYPEHPELGPTLEVAEALMRLATPNAQPRWLRSSQRRLTSNIGLRSLRPTG
jgi:hypothetical protein